MKIDERQKDTIVIEFTEDNLWSKNYPNLDEIEDEIFKYGYKIKPSQEYVNTKTKLVLFDNNGYYYTTTLGRLRKQQTPQFVGNRNPYSIDNIKIWTKNNRNEWEILSDKYINNEKLKLYNKQFNVYTEMEWHDFKCFSDGIKIARLKSRLTIEKVKENVSNKLPNIEVMSNKWETNIHKIKCKCNICENEFYSLYGNLMKGEGCPKCGVRKGENHGCWKGGITPLYNNIRGAMIQWKIDSYKKYNYKCDISRKKLKTNVIHHYHNYSDILEETLNLLNLDIRKNINDYSEKELNLIKEKCLELHYKYGLGVCLTEKLHKEFHSIYGQKNNTIEQYLEFKKFKLKEMNK